MVFSNEASGFNYGQRSGNHITKALQTHKLLFGSWFFRPVHTHRFAKGCSKMNVGLSSQIFKNFPSVARVAFDKVWSELKNTT